MNIRTKLILTSVLSSFIATAQAAGTVTISNPSDSFNNSVTIAPYRDFLVQGSLSGFGTEPVQLQILIADSAGTIIKTITASTNTIGYTDPTQIDTSDVSSSFNTKWSNNITALQNNPSPDLVADKTTAANKAVINRDGHYAALILGGLASGSGITNTSYLSTPGTYTITANVLDSENHILANATKDFLIANSNMLCARFSPTEEDGYPHLENAIAFGQANNLKVMIDPFPGYWSQKTTAFSDSVFYENLKMWRTNDLAEYLVAPETSVIIYNINATCATQGVEIGGLIKNNYLQDATTGHKVYFYRYDLGDISVTYTRSDGSEVTAPGSIVNFDGTHRSANYNQVAYARAERRSLNQTTDENIINMADTNKTIDNNVANGIYLRPNQTLSLIGAVTPIPTNDVTYNETQEFYTVNNRITNLVYNVTDPSSTLNTQTRAVNLTRAYTPTWNSASIYEFKHDFAAATFTENGVYSFSVSGTDNTGAVANTANTFNVIVSDTGLLPPSEQSFTLQQERVGSAMLDLHLDSIINGDDVTWQRYIATSGTAAAPVALSSLAGESKANSVNLVMQPAKQIFRHLQYSPVAGDVWADVFYSKHNNDDYSIKGSSIALGYDTQLAAATLGGIFIGKGNPRLTQGAFDRVEANDWQLGLYAAHNLTKDTALRGWFGYGRQSYELERRPLGLTDTSGSYDGHSLSAAIEYNHTLNANSSTVFTPAIGLDYQHVSQERYNEAGNTLTGLTFDKSSFNSARLYLGSYLNIQGRNSQIYGQLFYSHRLSNSQPQLMAKLNGGGNKFLLTGARASKNAINIGLGYSQFLTQAKDQKLSIGYDGEFCGGNNTQQYTLSYEYRF